MAKNFFTVDRYVLVLTLSRDTAEEVTTNLYRASALIQLAEHFGARLENMYKDGTAIKLQLAFLSISHLQTFMNEAPSVSAE